MMGGFSEYVGAEREHRCRPPAAGDAPTLWCHPTFSTVGTALRRIGERLGGASADRTRALALVPKPSGEKWASMLRHGTVVGSFGAGDSGLEANVSGKWHESSFRRPMLLVLFPRAAGVTPQPVSISYRMGITPVSGGEGPAVQAAGYAVSADGTSFVRQPAPGSYVYSLPRDGQPFGQLLRVSAPAPGEQRGCCNMACGDCETLCAALALNDDVPPEEEELEEPSPRLETSGEFELEEEREPSPRLETSGEFLRDERKPDEVEVEAVLLVPELLLGN